MRAIRKLCLAGALLLAAHAAGADDFGAPAKRALVAQAGEGKICIQVIACGTKNGKRRQYPTPCAARDDGAKDVAPMTGASCDEGK
jgi:hypothetical protein